MSVIQVSDFMVTNPTIIDPDASIIEVALKMRENRIGSLILVEDNKPIGIIARANHSRNPQFSYSTLNYKATQLANNRTREG